MGGLVANEAMEVAVDVDIIWESGESDRIAQVTKTDDCVYFTVVVNDFYGFGHEEASFTREEAIAAARAILEHFEVE